ncbi:MAG TPA: ribonuclease III [Candidatus Solibacter sp.]|nr:ribonuclease III [Candidatus Solibacter sp.]
MLESERAELESRLGYVFRDPAWIELAMTHSSRHAETRRSGAPQSNERLELLGDSVLGLVITDRLTEVFSNWNLGRLNRAKAHLVSAGMLSEVARRLELGRFLQLGAGEDRTGGREKRKLLADAYEAVVAAIYRDSGSEPAREFVLRTLWEPSLADGLGSLGEPDAKTALQERLRELHLEPGEYRLVNSSGPEHERIFHVEFRMGGKPLASAEGRSKKQAELEAARQALESLEKAPAKEN